MISQYVQELISEIPLSPWLIGPVIALLWMVVLLFVKKAVLARSHGYLAGRTNWAWADSLIEALSPTITIVIIAGAIALLGWILPLNSRAEHAVYIILVGTITLGLMIFAARMFRGRIIG